MKKLIIHPGFHKTGTTALQQALSEVRDELSAKGFNYPKIAGNAHHRAAWSIIEKTWGWKKRGGRLMAPIEWQKLDRKLKSGKDAAIISSEFFSQASKEQLDNLAGKVKSTEVEVIFTWRPLPFMLASSYQQYLKYGLKLSYSEWLDSIFESSGKAKMLALPGHEGVKPSDSDIAAWRKLSDEMTKAWYEDTKKVGVNGEQALSELKAELKKRNAAF